MGHPRDVDAYPDLFLRISAVLRTTNYYKLGPMPLLAASHLRHNWYAFVRAHRYTINATSERINRLALSAKHPLAQERIAPAKNELLLNRAREARLDVIKKFAVCIEHIANDLCCIVFEEKGQRFGANVLAQVNAAFRALPAAQQRYEEQIQMELETSARTASDYVDPTPALRDDPLLAQLFEMPREEREQLLANAPAQLDKAPPVGENGLALGALRADESNEISLDEFLTSAPKLP